VGHFENVGMQWWVTANHAPLRSALGVASQIVPPTPLTGLEPAHTAPEAAALSTELQGHSTIIAQQSAVGKQQGG
jgi:hypothetical protein